MCSWKIVEVVPATYYKQCDVYEQIDVLKMNGYQKQYKDWCMVF